MTESCAGCLACHFEIYPFACDNFVIDSRWSEKSQFIIVKPITNLATKSIDTFLNLITLNKNNHRKFRTYFSYSYLLTFFVYDRASSSLREEGGVLATKSDFAPLIIVKVV